MVSSGDLQHCAECQEEYVAGVAACVECGGPLTPGPLERNGGAAAPLPARAMPGSEMDRLLGRWPGLQADHAVRALLAEGVACRVECGGSVKVYQPGKEPTEPFAVTLPVSVYVAGPQLENARELLLSLEQDDVIGDQWSEVPEEAESADDDAADDHDAAIDAAPPQAQLAEAVEDSPPPEAPVAQSTSLRTAVLLVVAGAVVLYLLLAR
jgi:hypothetical protein